MAATRRVDTEEYTAATAAARSCRLVVAEQLRALVVEADQMSGRTEFAGRIERILFCERRIAEAQGRQRQAREMGLPVSRAVQDEREMRSLLREAVMGAAVVCAGWAADMDYELAREEDEAGG